MGVSLAIGVFGLGATAALMIQVAEAGGIKALRTHRVALGLFGGPFLLFGLSPAVFGALLQCFIFLVPLYFVIAYKAEMVPPLGERMLLSLDILFWYVFLTRFGLGDDLRRAAALILGIPSVYIVALALTRATIGTLGKVIAYGCHFIYSALLGFWQLRAGLFPALRRASSGSALGFLDVLSAGFATAFLFINIGYLIVILFSEKKKTRGLAASLWPGMKAALAARYDGQDLVPAAALAFLVLEGSFLAANHRHAWLPEDLAVNAALLLVRWLP